MSPSSRATGWVRRHKVISTLIALLVLGWATGATGDDRSAEAVLSAAPRRGPLERRGPTPNRWRTRTPAAESAEDSGEKKAIKPPQPASSVQAGHTQATPKPNTKPKRAPKPRTYLVTRVIDGDTIELGNGSDVRIVGIDTPEVGQCGYDAATNNMARLVLNKQVRLTMSDEDTDHYGRWLRYVNVGPVDAGLQQIKQGFRDRQVRLARRLRVPRSRTQLHRGGPGVQGAAVPQAGPAPPPAPSGGGACAPGYDPCVPPSPPDVDCADVDGPIG